MSQEHEYALLQGFSRTRLGRILTLIASGISAGLVFLALRRFDLVKDWGIDQRVPPMVTSLLGAGIVFTVLYFVFDQLIWRWQPLGRLLKAPNLAGTWRCEGLSEDRTPPQAWAATVTITQTWDRLRIHLDAPQSASDSIAAALVYDATTGHRLLYHYRNEPKFGQAGLAAHHGFGDLTFAPDGRTASGGYFNGHGRNTYGTMQLTREAR